MSSYERDHQEEELVRRLAAWIDNAADETVGATLVPQRMIDPKVEPPNACRCGFAWASIEGGTAADYCHHTWPNGSEEWLVVCPRCRADGPLKASAEWAIAAWDEQSRLTDPVEALRANPPTGNMTPPVVETLIGRCVTALQAVDYRQSSGDLDWRIVMTILDALNLDEIREVLAGAILEHDAGGITLATSRQMREVLAKIGGGA